MDRAAFSRRTAFGVVGTVSAAALLGTTGAASAAPLPIAPSGAWCWFGGPRAVHHRKHTYLGYLTDSGQIVVAQYDHETARLSHAVLAENFEIDDHNNPAIHVLPDGRLEVYWTAHARNIPLYYRRSRLPGDITGGWEPARTITTNTVGQYGWTYTTVAQLSAEKGRKYLFWRGADFNPAFSTTDGGDQWTEARSLIQVPGQRPYVKLCTNGRDTIHFAFTDGHPRNVHTSIYYVYYRAGHLHRANGERIGPLGTPISPSQADKVYDATGQPKSWIWEIATDHCEHPVLVYANFPADTDHHYRYARWDGKAWQDHHITAAGDSISADGKEPNYSGGISLDHGDPATVLLSRQAPGGRHEVERWRTPDGGRTWTGEPITRNSAELNVRPFKPVGLSGNDAMSVLWMAGEYPSYVGYRTRIMALGPDGRAFSL
ncbi:BNR-4 repeat-containing protein [Amycolatopsis sp. 195334CR]|uniref:BNR-4 repeat-containing protein n=1 Tax=Amycolatopsis sp. 195334CR TaxID=2814588 RepID=UPI001F5DD51B|nr:BNR-4 repeat-containing protein [Amycolatopsis sp. 195334CR]